MASPQPALDEIVGRREDVINWWLTDPKNGLPPPPYTHMEERFIHRYFTEQPFFDWNTKNGMLFEQAQREISTYSLVHDRQALESALRKRPGIEYMITHEPQVVKGVAGQKTGVWVLRKQERLAKQPADAVPTDEDPYPATLTRGTYYIVNENVYQAPSVADVVGKSVFEKAAALPSFTPTTGHTYLPPASTKSTTGTSRQASPSRSREGSVAPGMDIQSLRSTSQALEGSQGAGAAHSTSSDDILATRLLIDSLRQTATYGEEFMDENPLLGEPGSFKFTSSTAAVKKRKADEEAAALAAQKAKELKLSAQASRAASPKAEVAKAKAPTPPSVFTEKAATTAKTEKERREGKKAEKKSRRKSKALAGTATSPTTPKSATSVLGPAGAG
ncbi:Mediator of RNA polymerase II transcription subunit 6 [Teratosphaeriaceae sp. CCFEE 6253]|nr:Mediator of RNA polymerase II transcription subunit 6 [Teratosphaeriaceae sp. CCFEE 6253]